MVNELLKIEHLVKVKDPRLAIYSIHALGDVACGFLELENVIEGAF
jgi:hypothetical protein